MNLKRVVAAIPEWNAEEADMYKNVKRMYEGVISQFNRYSGHVGTNIGGRYVTQKSIEQPGPVYAPVPKEKQKAALDYFNRNVFTKPSWLVDLPYIYNITDQPDNYLRSVVNNVVSTSNLLNIAKLTRMGQFAQADSSNYRPEEYLSDLTSMIFSELGKGKAVDSYRRYLQRRFVSVALTVVNNKDNALTDGRALILAELKTIETRARKAKSSDAVTKAHWQSIAQQIEEGLHPSASTDSSNR